ncbi:MAG: PadR family transcriptional regulator [Planctomycetota bacterium]
MSRSKRQSPSGPVDARHAELAGRSPIYQGMVRGMLPYYVLTLLREAPRYGTELMVAIHAATGGTWKPSPGSLYPLLKRLEDQGLVIGRLRRGPAAPQRVYRISRRGREEMRTMQREIVEDLRAARGVLDEHIRWFENAVEGGSEAVPAQEPREG